MTKIELQKQIMLKSRAWWNSNDLHGVVCDNCKRLGLTSVNPASVERNIRSYREPKHGVIVHKRKISTNTFEYKITKGFL
jgi:hypothetical protein